MFFRSGTRKQFHRPLPASLLPTTNPWVPWVEPLLSLAPPSRGSVLAIIPTAGRDLARLQRCLGALHQASTGVRTRILLVVCPGEAADPGAERLGHQVLYLSGPFNYPRSINAGLAHRHDERFALLLNDDCELEAGALAQLRETLSTRRWCAVGPQVKRMQGETGGVLRQSEPLSGCCVLWDFRWLDRVGRFDEQFGLGYGFDESDQHLRALRMGALWGTDGRVAAVHEGSATFGKDVRTSAAWHENRERWRAKHPHADYWGGSPHWDPLPGISVVMAGYNVRPWLERALRSVGAALAGQRWGLAYADDGSTDGSWELAQRVATRLGADWLELERFGKARGVGGAKNRALKLAQPHFAAYPAIFPMDADDVMRRERGAELLWRVRDGGHRLAHGAWLASGEATWRGALEVPTFRQQRYGGWSPCTAVLHASLIPEDGKLANEELLAYEDAEWTLRLLQRGVISAPIPEAGAVHEYWVRNNSVQTSVTPAIRAAWEARRAEILGEA